jgi:hypothetical protein
MAVRVMSGTIQLLAACAALPVYDALIAFVLLLFFIPMFLCNV